MDLFAAILGVPWQQWTALAAAAWVFALVCFIGAFGRRSVRRISRASSTSTVLLDHHRRPRASNQGGRWAA